MAAKFIDSQTRPQPVAPSPMLATAMPSARVSFLCSAAPAAMPAEAPTMALLG